MRNSSIFHCHQQNINGVKKVYHSIKRAQTKWILWRWLIDWLIQLKKRLKGDTTSLPPGKPHLSSDLYRGQINSICTWWLWAPPCGKNTPPKSTPRVPESRKSGGSTRCLNGKILQIPSIAWCLMKQTRSTRICFLDAWKSKNYIFQMVVKHGDFKMIASRKSP